MTKIRFKKEQFLSILGRLGETLAQLADGKEYVLEIKEHRERRSLDANAYFWVLCGKLAAAVHTDNWSMYLQLLERYGVFTYIVVKPSAVEQFKREYRLVNDLGEVKINGKTGVQLQCFFGQHTYDTAQMSRLIEGTISECKEVGIETRTPEEIAKMVSLWESQE